MLPEHHRWEEKDCEQYKRERVPWGWLFKRADVVVLSGMDVEFRLGPIDDVLKMSMPDRHEVCCRG